MDRQRMVNWLLGLVAVGTGVALMASMAHMLSALVWANRSGMAWGVAAVLVILNAVLVGFAIVNDDPRVQRAVVAGVVLLSVVEFFGNFSIGGLLVSRNMPADLAAFYGVSPGFATRAAAFLLAGFLPILNFLTVYALAHSLSRSLKTPQTNPYVEEAMALLGQKG